MNGFYDDNQLNEIKEAFNIFDKSGDGFIDIKEIGHLLRSLGENPTRAEILQIIQEFDQDSNGLLDFLEFLKMMEQRARLAEKIDEYKKMFEAYDRDKNGKLSQAEVKQIVKKHPKFKLFKDHQIEEMILQADLDGDGQTSYEEFLSYMITMYKDL